MLLRLVKKVKNKKMCKYQGKIDRIRSYLDKSMNWEWELRIYRLLLNKDSCSCNKFIDKENH